MYIVKVKRSLDALFGFETNFIRSGSAYFLKGCIEAFLADCHVAFDLEEDILSVSLLSHETKVSTKAEDIQFLLASFLAS